MPIKYNINEEQNLVWATGSGVIVAKDIINHIDSLVRDIKYIAPMKKLIDYRNIENIIITQDEAEAIAEKKNSFAYKFSGEKCAFISPKDLSYGTARVHQAQVDTDNIDMHVFRTIKEALECLGIPLDSNQNPSKSTDSDMPTN